MGDKGKKDHEKRKKQKSAQKINTAKKKQAAAPVQEHE